MQPITLVSLLILVLTFLIVASVDGAPIRSKTVIDNHARSKKAVSSKVQSRPSRQLADLGKSQSLGTGGSTATSTSRTTKRKVTSTTTKRKVSSTTAKPKTTTVKATRRNRQAQISQWDWQ